MHFLGCWEAGLAPAAGWLRLRLRLWQPAAAMQQTEDILFSDPFLRAAPMMSIMLPSKLCASIDSSTKVTRQEVTRQQRSGELQLWHGRSRMSKHEHSHLTTSSWSKQQSWKRAPPASSCRS